ncbi:MAG: hypothetical protein K6A14_00560, partial [Erysipelotrichaceae bacterium]|nr:hypothetical protein [Erysipelotrichaceae bacterium]
MIRRRLIIVNIVILTLTLSLATIFETRALKSLLYRENTISYNSMIASAHQSLQDIFKKGEDRLLTACANRQVQEMIRDSLPEHSVLNDTLNTLASLMDVERITVYPVRGSDVYIWDDEAGMYNVEENGLYDFELDYSYEWSFRPDNVPAVRVTRAIYATDNIEEIIGIASVDISLTEFTEIIYSFKGNSSDDYLCLLAGNNEYLLPSNKTGKLDIEEAEGG